jgi:hypothetical protein
MSWRNLLSTRGAVTTEYAVLVGTCGIVIAAAVAALGPPIVLAYRVARHTVIAPVP